LGNTQELPKKPAGAPLNSKIYIYIYIFKVMEGSTVLLKKKTTLDD